ncbi:HEAT repeat domain-containing protein [Streptomyces sp. PT12]|uniref:HEAT repeat domain-containing protein n=1 Tax=Streptomyces sp. PT12 TaxID=1510197 RepID=UPI000DE2AF6A|nr:HEAT repeat domain-containing protein [Streptomyces sp. PT12]RBM19063.1 hypothetical protein DEH69_11700 [Streptomyces sp. PT12]
MTERVEDLIEQLGSWRAGDVADQSPRERVLAELSTQGPHVVPVLIKRLRALVTASAQHRDQVSRVPAADESADESAGLKQGIIEALHRIGDQQAGPVLTASLADPACRWAAARALKDVRDDDAVGPLLDTLARAQPSGSLIWDIADTLRSYPVPRAVIERRLQAEKSQQGQQNLNGLLAVLAHEGDAAVADGLHAALSPHTDVRLKSVEELAGSGRGGEEGETREALTLLALDKAPPVSLRAVQALGEPTPQELVREAIGLAARAERPARDLQLISRARHFVRSHPSGIPAVLAALEGAPELPAAEVHIVLELLSPLNADLTPEHPIRLLRALHGLAARPDYEIRHRSLAVLRGGDLLFTLMAQDAPVSAEARTIFDSFAEPSDIARFERFTHARPKQPGMGPTWQQRLNLFRRR